ncbi:MAG: trypsin-like peptidase domain-containing protein [Steroidobacteraceae bacterium]
MQTPRLRAGLAAGLIFTFFGPVVLGVSANEGPRRAPPAWSQASIDLESVRQSRAETHAWLSRGAVMAGLERPVRVQADEDSLRALDEAVDERPVRVGLAMLADAPVDLAGAAPLAARGGRKALGPGAIEVAADGSFVYSMAVTSPGATAMRLHFTGFHLPVQAAMYLYTAEGEVFGPYTGKGPLGDGDFWSHTLVGERINLQVRYVGEEAGRALRQSRFKIAGVGHVRPKFMASTCSFNASCVEDASCTTEPAVAQARSAVAHMQWVSGRYLYICTGGLLNDTSDSGRPWFLTANHCISSGKDARSLENFFQFVDDSCSNRDNCLTIQELRASWPAEQRTLGARIVSTSRNTDHTLFELAEAAPSGAARLGWNAEAVANSSQLLHRISHPGGAPQSYSSHQVDPDGFTCTGYPRGNFIYSQSVVGATEGGSSGSPVVNGSGEVVGQLFGACGSNLGNKCDTVNNRNMDGAFAAYFSQVSQYLDPQPSNCTPSTEICDGLDNDCDGQIDEGDVCGGGGGNGLPTGSACNVNSDCASNSCKGKPGAKVCK